MNARALAARVLAGVLADGQTLEESLEAARAADAGRDAALVRELCAGVLRWHPRLAFIAGLLLRRPLPPGDTDITALILCGLYQLANLRVPDHAAVSETVEAARELGKPWATKVINAVLRRFQRERADLEARAHADPAARHAHPKWLLETLRRDWPEEWSGIVESNNGRPPLHLRVNARRTTPDEYLGRLAAAGLGAEIIDGETGAIRLETPVDVTDLPGFAEGLVSVQDAGAQRAAFLLDPGAGHRVLDACAAPGGKTAHILERFPAVGSVLALDRDASRLERARENLARLGLEAEVRCADASKPETWWDCQPFDRILLDVPCSATGVIRRHPDVKVLRKPGQVRLYTRTQDELLTALWPLLRRGGRMLYCTCSLLREENDTRVAFLRDNLKDVRVLDITGAWGTGTPCGRQAVPGLSDTDGFYYALLEKV